MPHSSTPVVEPGQDRRGLWAGQDAQADEEPGVIVDEADDPDLLVLTSRAAQEERALDVDVPQLVGAAALIGGSTFPVDRRSGRAELGQQAVDGMVVERIDLAPGELGRQALGVPVGQQAHDDDRLLDPGRQALPLRTAWSIDEGFETTSRVADPPAVEARPTGPDLERRGDALVPGDTDASKSQAQAGHVGPWRWPGRPAAPRRQEEEARALLIRVPKETTMWLGAVLAGDLVHPRTLGRVPRPCLTNPGNYT